MEVPVQTFELLTCVSAAGGVALAIGWREGYHSVTGCAVFWLFLALAGLTSIGIERHAFKSRGVADHVLRVGIIALALIVLCGLLLGSAGLLGRVPYLAFFGVCAVWTMAWRTVDPPVARRGPIPVPAAVVALVSPIVIFIVAVGLTHLPGRYDSLNYHLYFPARWLQDHRLSIVPTPFGDEAPAYAPSNGELWFLWLMLPFHGDLVARIGQIPFYLLIGVAQYLLARRMGAKPVHAMWIPAFFLLARPIVESAVGADVDLIFTAMFVTSVYLGIIAVDTNRRSDWILWGVSLGLCWGTKYLALVYVPVFLLLALMRGPRLRSLWAAAGVAALALPWYVRNWIVAGSPVYPASLKIAGLTIARGAFDRSAMLSSIFHLTDFRLFGVVAGHGFGTPLFLVWMPLWLIGAAALLARGPWWPTRFLVLLPVAAVPLDWFGAPDNSDWRFIFPIIAVALLPLAFTFREKEGANRAIHLLYAAGLTWLILGLDRNITVPLSTVPYYMRDWLSLRGLVPVHHLPLFTILAAAAVYCWRVAGRARHGLVLAFGMFSAACAFVGAASQAACPPGGCELLDLTSAYIRQTMFDGWSWVREHTHDATIAYSGNNIPYPLYGDRLTNRVYYVNIDRHLQWRLHDFDRAEKRRRDDMRAPDTARLALSSGVLVPIVAGAAANGGAVRPRFERMEGYRDAWLANLKALHVTHLFVTALSAYEIDYMWHDPQGFPIEAQWAAADPAAFVLVYENPQVKIYAVSLK